MAKSGVLHPVSSEVRSELALEKLAGCERNTYCEIRSLSIHQWCFARGCVFLSVAS